MESPYFERSRYRTDYHCNVVLYSTLESNEIHPILKQIARQSIADEGLFSRDNIGGSSSLKYDSRDSHLPNPIPVIVPLTEPTNMEESNRARLNIKIYVKNRQLARQELIVDAAAEFDVNSHVDFVILLFDLTDRSSFDTLNSLLQEFMNEYSAVNLAEPTTILAVGKVQSQEIHQLIFRDEIDLWSSHQQVSSNIAIKYFEYNMLYSQGVNDLLAIIIEPFQTKYTTQLSRGKSLESPIANRSPMGIGFFHSSFAQGKEKINADVFDANNLYIVDSTYSQNPNSSLTTDQQRQRSISAPSYNYHHTQDGISKSDLIEMQEEQKCYERQRKWQDMESQMRLMLETDKLEEDRLAEIEQERLQQQHLQYEQSTSGFSSPPNQQHTNNNMMSGALGFFRNIHLLSHQSKKNKSNTNFAITTSSSLSLQQPILTINYLPTISSGSSLSPPPSPPPRFFPSSPSIATHRDFFIHNDQNNSKSSIPRFTTSSFKSRSEDACDCHPAVQPLKKAQTPDVRTSNIVPLPPELPSRPVSTSTLRLPPLPGNISSSSDINLSTMTINTSLLSNNNNIGLALSGSNGDASSLASATILPLNNASSTNASNNYCNNIVVAASSSSSSISNMQNVPKRTGSMLSQASQRTSSQISLRSHLSSRNTMNSNSRASSGLDLLVPSADEINLLIETMHSAVKSEQELFQRTMYLYGASGSDLLLLSSEDEDDRNEEESDAEKSSGSRYQEKDFHRTYSHPSSHSSQTIPKSSKHVGPKPRSPHPVQTNSNSYNNQTNTNSSTHNSSSSDPYRSYISDLSTVSSRYTQSSLEERGLIDPERLLHLMTASAYNNHHVSFRANNSSPFPALNQHSQKHQEDLVVASLLNAQAGHFSQDKEEEDRILDIIVGLSPSTDIMSSPPSSSRKRLSSSTSKRHSKGEHEDKDNNSNTITNISNVYKDDNSDLELSYLRTKLPALEDVFSSNQQRTRTVFIIGHDLLPESNLRSAKHHFRIHFNGARQRSIFQTPPKSM